MDVMPEAGTAMQAAGAEQQRMVVGVDSLLELRPLLLGQAPSLDRLVDPVLQRLLQRVRECLGLDAELLGGVVDDRLALFARRQKARRGYGTRRTEADHEQRRVAAVPAAKVIFLRLRHRSDENTRG